MATLQTNPREIIRLAFGKTPSYFAMAILAVGTILLLLVPLPGFMLDLLMTLGLMMSLLTLLIALSVKSPVEFSVFPTVLLVSTVFNLALSVASTKMILERGPAFDGQLIIAFGNFVIGSRGTEGLVIGLIIFIIIIVVQVMVITKGATRVTEVAARFALDSMQMKQMAIDNEFNQGAISEAEMNQKKKDLQKSMDFYSAMDGAGKFISGSVKASILTTIVNIIGGLIIGAGIRGEALANAFGIYTRLTVGDGLVTQLPMLFISVATGLLVTRSTSEASFDEEATKQFSTQARIYLIAGFFLLLMAFIPGFPTIVMLLLAGLSLYIAYILSRREWRAGKEHENDVARGELEERNPEMAPVVPLDTLSLELGYSLIPLVDKEQGAELLERITRIRREAAMDLGLVASPIRITDNMRLESHEYRIKIKGSEVGRGKLRLDQYLAMNTGGVIDVVPGDPTKDPAFGIDALWITDEYRDKAERYGYTVVDSPSILATHLTEVIQSNAASLLGRQETQNILDELRKKYPAVVDAINSIQGFNTASLQKILQMLLGERVSIRDIVTILETISDYAAVSTDVNFLGEKVRIALSRQITNQYVDDDRILRVITIEPSLEAMIMEANYVSSGSSLKSTMSIEQHRAWINALLNTVQAVRNEGYYPIILCASAEARPFVKASALKADPSLTVLASLEITSDVQLEVLGEVRLN
ncbi:MAG: flagellar biosynthesis protein FlhA [Spirochaetaceae bacterium]|nr:flagellar biosynthesis protein FlhA [Spirochaetaceae bacterium]